jgi:RNA polymerase sigma-70 factor (ECF subfamily)
MGPERTGFGHRSLTKVAVGNFFRVCDAYVGASAHQPVSETPANLSLSSDVDLIRGIAGGDEEAFVELYRRRRADVYRFALAMSKSAALAQDVTQDVFLGVLQDASGFDAAKGAVRAWLLGCARHRVVDRMRRDSRSTDELPEDGSEVADGEEHYSKRQQLYRLHAAIVGLPLEYREAIVLCELAELSYAESAAVLGCPVGTIRSRLHRAKALLALRLGESNPAPLAAAEPAERSSAAPAPLLKTSEVW